MFIPEEANVRRLNDLLLSGLGWDQSLAIAIDIVLNLHELHKNKQVYTRLNPVNVLISEDDVRLRSYKEAEEQVPLYMSPEQTGRIKKPIDHRSDFYSLGVVLYELFTGRHPFADFTNEEILYCHVAKTPSDLREINVDVPPVISRIVMKLLLKNPEERYQSAFSLEEDLSECLRQIKTHNLVFDFPIAVSDHSGKVRSPERIYGRDNELQELRDALENISAGASGLVLISGDSGVGKTSIIDELRKGISASEGYFISGKFDQISQEVPYSAFIQAFKKLIVKSTAHVAEWRKKFLNVLGSNCRLIIDVVPELELIVGHQPLILPVPPLESKNRFNQAFKDFIRVIAREESQLIIFIDDLQWADSGSLELLKLLLSDKNIGYLLLIASYRTKEIDAKIIQDLERELQNKRVAVSKIDLKDLASDHLTSLLAECLNCSNENAAFFQKLVYDKTNGNPFFVMEFLRILEKRGLLWYEQKEGWLWDEKRIQDLEVTSNVVELLSERLLNAPEKQKVILKTAACIGNSFRLKDLSILIGERTEDLLPELENVVAERFIIQEEEEEIAFTFIHDRIRESVYKMLAQEEKIRLHYTIGSMMLKEAKDENIFYVVNHLNSGRKLIEGLAERKELALMNLKAGRKAREANAFTFALNFFCSGISLIEGEIKDRLIWDLYIERAECEYLNGNTFEAESIFNKVLKEVTEPIDKARIWDKKLLLYTSRGNYNDALEAGKQALKILGVHLENHPVKIKFHIASDIIRALTFLRKRDIEKLPQITSEKEELVVKILSNLNTPTFYVSQELYLSTALTLANYSFKHGNTDFSSSGYLLFCIALNALFGRYEKTFNLGNAALRLNERYKNEALTGKLYAIFYGGIHHWVKPIKSSFAFLDEGFVLSKKHGDFHYARTLINVNLSLQIRSGKNLNAILDSFISYKDFMGSKEEAIHLNDEYRLYLYFLDLLTSGSSGSALGFNEMEFLQINAHTPFNLAYYYIYKARYYLLKEQFQEATVNGRNAYDLLKWIKSTPMESEGCFYYLLSMVPFYTMADYSRKRHIRNAFKRIIPKFSKWSATCPDNFEHQYLFLRAEKERMLNNELEAVRLYRESIDSARRYGYLNIEAMANEALGKLFKDLGHDEIASSYFSKSFYLYNQWGASVKVNDLLNKYPQWLGSIKMFRASGSAQVSDMRVDDLSLLDYEVVMKASQAISEEISPDMLIRNLMKIVMEVTGAQRGALFLNQEQNRDEFFLEAEASIDKDCIILEFPVPLEQAKNYPVSVLNYAARIKQKTLYDPDVIEQEAFKEDPFILENKIKSLLCKPFRKGKEVIGLLYLENNLIEGVFNENKTSILNSLCNQAAISIENARMYAKTRALTSSLEKYNKSLLSEIAERKHIEEKLRLKNEELNIFMYRSSHDLRGPISSILGITDLAVSEIKEEKAAKYLSLIRESSLKLDRILLELIAINRMKQADPLYAEVDFESVLDEVIEKLNTIPGFKEVRIEKTISLRKPFVCDKLILTSIFQNLLDNAVRYRNVSVEESHVIIRINDHKDIVRIIVKDNGSGINEEISKKVFEMFFRGSPDPHGTGLGLYIVKSGVEKLGGTIELKSNMDSGTEFIISLPFKPGDKLKN